MRTIGMTTLTVPTLPPLRRVRSSWLDGIAYLPSPDASLGEGRGLLIYATAGRLYGVRLIVDEQLAAAA